MSRLTNALVASSLLAGTPGSAHEGKALSWTPEVSMSTKLISDIQLSPDNKWVLFVVSEPKMEGEKGVMLSKIYKGSSSKKEGAIPFSAEGTSSVLPRWSPSGAWIAFVSNAEGTKNLYLIPSEGGEAVPLTKGKKDVQTFSWSPDSKQIAFVMADETEVQKNQKKTSLAYVYGEETPVNRLWLLDVFASKPSAKPLTSDAYCVRGYGDYGTSNAEFDWSPNGKQITFAHSSGIDFDSFHLDSSLATIDITTGNIVDWEKRAPYEAMPRYSPNGTWIAYLSSDSPQRYSIDRRVAVRATKGGEPRLLAKTANEGPLLMGAHLLGWTKEGKNILFFEPHRTKFHLVSLPIDGGAAQEVKTGSLFFKEPALSYDKTMLAFVAQTPATPPEAFVAKLDNFTPVQVSALNEGLLAYPKTKTEIISWTSPDGLEIEGLLTYPIGYKEGETYPLLLVIHGGPMGFFDETFLAAPNPYPISSFAQEGFLIFRPNPRGSCGYGGSFRHANYNDWGGGDFLDIMSGVDHLIAEGLADPNKLGVMGWSYGGYMTAWAVTQTDRFKAASMGAGLYNLISMDGTTDLPNFLSDYLGIYSENRVLYEERSPIHYVRNIQTPCLIQHSTADTRVPVSQVYEWHHALKQAGKEATLVLYPGMGHRISDPNMQLDAMKRNLDWFKQRL